MVKMIKARELDPELAAFVVESCGGMGPFLRNAIHCVNLPESGTLKTRMKLVWQILGACTEEERPEMVGQLCPELRLQVFLADRLAERQKRSKSDRLNHSCDGSCGLTEF